MMRFMTLATAAMFLVAVLTMAMWPEQARFGAPSQSVAQQQSKPVDDVFGDDSPESENPFGGQQEQNEKPLPEKPKAKPIQPSKRTQDRNKIRKVLNQPIDLVYDSQPFGDVRQQLARDMGVNIVIDANLEGNLDDDTEISANLVGVPLSQGLRMLLKPADATWVIKHGVLLIISVDDEHEPDYLTRHMFDVREILELVKELDSDRVGRTASGASGRSGGGVFRLSPQLGGGGGAVKPEKELPSESLTAEHLLVNAITLVVHPDAWQSNGTGNCDLTCIGGVLVVISNESVAEEVEDFLADLKFQMKNQD